MKVRELTIWRDHRWLVPELGQPTARPSPPQAQSPRGKKAVRGRPGCAAHLLLAPLPATPSLWLLPHYELLI